MNPQRKPTTDASFYAGSLAPLFDLIVYETAEAEADADELAFLGWAFRKVARRKVEEVLDAGCGMGRFVVPLARRGYRVTGLDRGAGAIAECRRRLKRNGLCARLLRRDIETVRFDSGFDAVIGMDSVICYIHDPDRIVDTLGRFLRALRPGGVVVLSNWNVLAQVRRPSRPRRETVELDGLRVVHTFRNRFNPVRRLFHIHVSGEAWRGRRCRRFDHHETVRAVGVREMKTWLRCAGFEKIEAYPDFDRADRVHSDADFLTYVARRPLGAIERTQGTQRT